MADCYPCRFPGLYKLDALKWLRSEKKLCDKHLEKANHVLDIKEIKREEREPGMEG